MVPDSTSSTATIATPGIYLYDSVIASQGFVNSSNRVALVGMVNGSLTFNAGGANCVGGGNYCLISSEGSHRFLYVEGSMNADGADHGIFLNQVKYSRLRNLQIQSASLINVYLDNSDANRIENLSTTNAGSDGLKLERARYNVVNGVYSKGNFENGIYVVCDSAVPTFTDKASKDNYFSSVAADNSVQGFYMYNGYKNTINHITTNINDQRVVFILRISGPSRAWRSF